jgi:N-acetylmuramoyl-L-alanine amidase
MRIFIDPGHGGRDPGAVNGRTGIRESELVLRHAFALRGALLRAGHDVLLSRDADCFVTLAERAGGANAWGAGAVISLHANAAADPRATGFEVWTSPGVTPADYLATMIFYAVRKGFPGYPMRSDFSDGFPDKEGLLYILKRTAAPAVLVELGFVSNDAESRRLADPSTIGRYAAAVAGGIEAWLGNYVQEV